MTHPLVLQLRFTRHEFMRGMEGLTDADARQRLLPMNSISWNIGHMAWQEQRYFLFFAQGRMLMPEVQRLFAYGAPACTPALEESLTAWKTITQAADPWLDSLTTDKLLAHVAIDGQPSQYIFGDMLQRVIYHYWYHTGESQAIRQSLGHQDLAEFVGNLDDEASFQPG